MPTKTMRDASLLWDYMSSFSAAGRSDAIVVCCSYDMRVCDHACDLMGSNLANRLVLSGNAGNWTRHFWSRPEAQVFLDRAVRNGVSGERILVEDQATNLGENVRFSRKLLGTAKTVTFVTKPATVLRLKLTVEAQWPEVEAYVSCPKIRFPGEVSNTVGILGVISEMVGDLDRIRCSPELGYQAPHVLPVDVLAAWQRLVRKGFNHNLTQAAVGQS